MLLFATCLKGYPSTNAQSGHSLQSSLCLGEAAHGEDACMFCLQLSNEGVVTRRTKRSAICTYSQFTNHNKIKAEFLVQRLREAAIRKQDLFFVASQAKANMQVAMRRAQKAESKLKTAITHDNCPKYLSGYIRMAEEGVLPPKAQQDFLEDMGKSNIMQNPRRSATTKSFYSVLRCTGSPWVAQFVAMNFGGPSQSSMKGWRSKEFPGIPAGRVATNLDKLVEQLLAHDLLQVPGIWSEDATTCLKRLAAALSDNPDGLDILVEGFTEAIHITGQPQS